MSLKYCKSYFVTRNAFQVAKKSAKKGPERFLLFELNQILVILRYDDRRTAGRENVCRWFFFKKLTLTSS